MRHFEQQHHQEQNTDYGHQRSWQEGTSNEAEYFGEPAAFGSKSKKPPNLNIFHQNQNRSIFVRDLPFHTTAQILREFIETVLEQPGAVEEAMVRYSQQGKTLQVACVLLRSETLVPSALEKLHGRIFFGRNLRVTVFNNKAPIEDSQNAAVQFSFLANDAQMPLVTEEVVRAHMEEMYGPLRDVCIRFHKYSESGIQSGYGFLTFTNESDNERAVDEVQKKVIHNLQYDCRWSSKCKPVSAPGTLRNKRLAHLAAATPTYGPEALATVQQNRQQSPVPRPHQPPSSSTSNNREEAPGLDTPPAPLQRYPSYQGNHHFQHHHSSRDAAGMMADYRSHHRGAGRPPSPPPAYSYSRGGMFPEEQFPPHYQSSRYDPSPPYHRHNTSRDYLFDEMPHSRVPPPPDAYDPYYNDPELPPRERDTLLSYEDSFRGFDARPSALQDFDLTLPYERAPAYRSHHHPHGQPRGYSLPTQLHPSYAGRSQVGGALSYDGYTTDSSRSRMFSSTSSAGHRGLHEAELHYLQQYRRDFTDDRRATHSLSSSMSSSAYRTSSTDYPLGFVNYPDDLTSTAASRTVSDASVHSRSPLMSALLQPKLHGVEEDPCAPSSAATSLSLGGLTPSYFDVPRSANQSIDSVLPPSSLHSNKAISPNNAFGISRSLDMPSSTASLDVPFVNAEEERSNNNSSLWSSFHVDVTNLLAPSSQSETSPTSAPSS